MLIQILFLNTYSFFDILNNNNYCNFCLKTFGLTKSKNLVIGQPNVQIINFRNQINQPDKILN